MEELHCSKTRLYLRIPDRMVICAIHLYLSTSIYYYNAGERSLVGIIPTAIRHYSESEMETEITLLRQHVNEESVILQMPPSPVVQVTA